MHEVKSIIPDCPVTNYDLQLIQIIVYQSLRTGEHGAGLGFFQTRKTPEIEKLGNQDSHHRGYCYGCKENAHSSAAKPHSYAPAGSAFLGKRHQTWMYRLPEYHSHYWLNKRMGQ